MKFKLEPPNHIVDKVQEIWYNNIQDPRTYSQYLLEEFKIDLIWYTDKAFPDWEFETEEEAVIFLLKWA